MTYKLLIFIAVTFAACSRCDKWKDDDFRPLPPTQHVDAGYEGCG